MNPEVTPSKLTLRTALTILFALGFVAMSSLAIYCGFRDDRQRARIVELEAQHWDDLQARSARCASALCPEPIGHVLPAMSTHATLTRECGVPSVEVVPGSASIALPSGCRVDVATECR